MQLVEAIIDFCYNFAPSGWQQDEQDFKNWLDNTNKVVLFSWENPYVLIEINLSDLTLISVGDITKHHQWFINYLNRLLERAIK
jgi:endonuclease IV